MTNHVFSQNDWLINCAAFSADIRCSSLVRPALFYESPRLLTAIFTGSQQIGFEREPTVTCKVCGSDQQSKFDAEIAIHFPGLKGLSKPHVWVFPELLVCLNCGKSEFTIPEDQLRLLTKGEAAAGG